MDLRGFVLETRHIERKFSFYVEVDFQDARSLRFDGDRFVIGYSWATDSSYFQSAQLLAEDYNDFLFFERSAEIYVASNREVSSICAVKLSCIPGGGSGIFGVFEETKALNKLFFCIVDSDKNHPGASIGSTASQFYRTQLGYYRNYMLEILECHELENIIPLKILTEVAGGELEGLIFSEPDALCFRKFADHKKGLLVSEAIQSDREHSCDYWQWLEDNGYEDDAVVCPPLGARILEHCVSYMRENNPHRIADMIDRDTDRYWYDISHMVASWGVGLRRVVR
ncbi:hypothetical protein [Pseudomonas sp. GD03944]|uniref:hypothetical protein n=1 Tax=Pseudomonas sp. GD03944 TaxID=2975409 RepID=UPI00244C868E|nr:hypothetical protein [Pseudomonas sp. GD03944]MDH1263556.1 hypothetical protein [Pseudomonas sp. GD03944]